MQTQCSLEELHLKRFHIALTTTLANLKSPLLEILNLTHSNSINDRGIF